jgi:hypothetical protein
MMNTIIGFLSFSKDKNFGNFYGFGRNFFVLGKRIKMGLRLDD